MATKIDEALSLAKKIRMDLPEENIALSAVLQNCKTICRYLGKLEDNKWIDYELNGYPQLDKTKDSQYDFPEYREVFQIFYFGNGKQVQMDNDYTSILGTIKLRQSIVELLQCKTVGMKVAASSALDMLNSQEFRREHGTPDYAPIVSHGLVSKSQLAKSINGVQSRIYEFLDSIILELEYGRIPEAIFETIRKEVDEKFRESCPNAIEKLIVIYEQLNSDERTVYSQIAGTCRQIIKNVADNLYPPEIFNENSNNVDLNDAKFLNRLSAGIASNTEKQLFKSMFNYTEKFLHTIHAYASKGDHNQFQRSDAIRCVVYTIHFVG